MNSILYPAVAGLNLIALIYKLRILRTDRSPVQWILAANFFFPVLIFTASTPVVWVATSQWAGIVNFSGLFAQGCVILLTASQQLILLHFAYERGGTLRRKAVPRMIGIGAALVAMVVLFATTTSPQEAPTTFAESQAQYYPVYLTVYLAAYLCSEIDLCILCWRYSAAAPSPWLRRGLRIVAMGLPCDLIYAGCRAADILAGQFGTSGHAWEWLAPISVTVNGLVKAVGWTMPDWGKYLDRARELLAVYRTHRILAPLHRDLTSAVPDVVLDLERADIRTRLYRRIVEIRDAQWALRTWMESAITAEDHRSAKASGLTGDALAAAVEAAGLHAALHAKQRGIKPVSPVDSPRLAEPESLVAELAFQRALTRAYTEPAPPLPSQTLLAHAAPDPKDLA
ncbi:MAB_1171c family putative transporter [Streptomyces sp. NPDC087300]|uniref:MAB_1171c family putative transporter n=1 Tax=Streptomyces sp. NPDC087300 TaxID=3365780 RepID=UPI00382D3017